MVEKATKTEVVLEERKVLKLQDVDTRGLSLLLPSDTELVVTADRRA